MLKISIFLSLFLTANSFCLKNFVLIAAPGSGKGTFCQHLVEKHGYVQICPGDIFRHEIEAQTELGKQIQAVVERGDYVDEAIVCGLIADRLAAVIASDTPFILDGFPRSQASLDFLCSCINQYNLEQSICFVQFVASDETCIERIVSRLICKNCCRVYNQAFLAPKKFNQCDACQSRLSTRTADTKEIAGNRLRYFHDEIEPLLHDVMEDFFVVTIDTQRPIEQLHALYDQLVEGVL